MKSLFYAVAILLAFVFQTTAFHFFSWMTVYPDMVLAMAIYGGLSWDRMRGLQFGGLVGFIQDLLTYGALGMNMLSKGLIGFLVGAMREKYVNDSLTARIIIIFSATALDLFLLGALTDMLFGVEVSGLLMWKFAPQAMLNLLAIPIALEIMISIGRKADKWIGARNSGTGYINIMK